MKRILFSLIVGIFLISSASSFASEISSLIENLSNKEKAKEASDKLAAIGKPAIPALIKALEKGDNDKKRYAARAIRQMGQAGSDAIYALAKVIDSGDSHTKEYAVEALGNMAIQIDEVIPILQKAKKDSDKDVKEKAKQAISNLCQKIKETGVLSELIKYRLNNKGQVQNCTLVELKPESSLSYIGTATFNRGEKSQIRVQLNSYNVEYYLSEPIKEKPLDNNQNKSIEPGSIETPKYKETVKSGGVVAEQSILSSQRDLALAKSKIDALENELSIMRSEKKDIEKMMSDVQSKADDTIAILKSDLTNSQDSIKQLISEKSTLNEKIDSLEKTLNSTNEKNASLEKELQSMRADSNSLRQNLAGVEQNLTKAQKELATSELNLSGVQKKLEKAIIIIVVFAVCLIIGLIAIVVLFHTVRKKSASTLVNGEGKSPEQKEISLTPKVKPEVIEGSNVTTNALSPVKQNISADRLHTSMSTGVAILFSVGLVVLCGIVGRLTESPRVVTVIMVVSTAIWVGFDAYNIELKKYKTYLARGPLGAAFVVLCLWLIFFPWYLSLRHKIKMGQAKMRNVTIDEYIDGVVHDPMNEQPNYYHYKVLSHLEKLTELKAKGILTEEEFQLQKSKLLSQ